MEPKWLDWARRLQALAQTGLTHAHTPFDRERYDELLEIAAEMMACQSDGDLRAVRHLFAEQEGYATPKVDVRGVVFKDGKLLLVKERRDGCWTLPGGWADVDDTPSEAVVREVFEESGYRTKAMKLLAVWDRTRHGHEPPSLFRTYKIFILCELLGGAPADSIETEGAEFFAQDSIPRLSLPRVTPCQIARLFEHARHPEWPADFD
jgi:ADP-ribose pyrophosphatase YjhB (NUDIX family)